MKNYKEDSKRLLDAIGGKDNIQALSHCVTRLRFVLVDPKKANVGEIEEIETIKGTFTQSGQFQVIIGNEVMDFYNDFIEVSGIEGVSKEAVKKSAQTQQSALQRMMGNLGEIFAPLIPALICGGLILGFRNCIDTIQFLEGGTKTLVEVSQFWQGVDDFLWLIGEAVFHFLPVGITWSITKKMGTTQILGIILGITLVSSQLLNAYSVAGTPIAEIPVWDFGFAQVQRIGYQAQVIPAILAGFALVYLERFFTKITPSYIRMIVVPLFSLILSVIIAHTILGPIGWQIGDVISNVVWSGLTSKFNWLFAAIFGFFYAPLVITGLHHMTNAIDTQLSSTFGGTILWPMIALSNIAQGSSVLAMIVLQRNNERAKQVAIPACISCYLGVTELALFGVNLKYTFPFISGMVGSAVAAIISVGTGTMAKTIGVGGIPGFLSILPQFMGYFLIAMAVSIVIPFILTYIIGSRKLTHEDRYGKEASNKNVFISPLEGNVLSLEQVSDQTFKQGLLGEGFAIEMTSGKVVAPFDGEIIMAFPTKHAYGIRRDDGIEVLIHIGMDTVELDGNGFTSYVEVGDRVTAGQTICDVDLNILKENNKSLVSPIVITSKEHVKLLASDEVRSGTNDVIEIY